MGRNRLTKETKKTIISFAVQNKIARLLTLLSTIDEPEDLRDDWPHAPSKEIIKCHKCGEKEKLINAEDFHRSRGAMSFLLNDPRWYCVPCNGFEEDYEKIKREPHKKPYNL